MPDNAGRAPRTEPRITPTRHHLMRYMDGREDEFTASHAARWIGLTRAATVAQLTYLESIGFAKRHPLTDRGTTWSITPAGRRWLSTH